MWASPSSSAKVSVGSDDQWLNSHRFAGLLALLVLASWPQVWLGLQTFEYRDFGIFSYPIAHYFRESFWRGEIPLWNPLSACGTPFLAQWNTQVLYPPALFYLLLPLSWSLGVFCLLHLFWGGLGMYVLAQAWTGNRRAAAFAGIAFAFNGVMLSSLIWPATIAGLGWMPWVVWLAQRAGREGGRTLILAALAGTMQMLSGAAEPVLLTWVLVAGLTLVELGRNAVARGKIIFRFGAMVALISALSAAQLLPFLDLLDYSRRQQEISAAVWPMPPTGWANYFVPLFHCHAFQGVFMQVGQSWINSYYVGLITLVLAGLALRQIRRPQVWLLAALLLTCGVLAVGEATPVYGWLARHVSVIGLVRFPVKYLILPALLLPLLAALALAKTPFTAGQKNQSWLLLIGGIVFVITLGIIGWIWWFEPPGADRVTVMVNGGMRVVFLVAILLAWRWSEKISGIGPRRLGQLLPLLLLWLDLNWQMPPPATVNRAIYEPNLPRSQPLPSVETARVLIPATVHNAFDHTALPDAATDYLVRRFGLAGNCNLLDHVAKCDGFFPLYLSAHAAWYYNYFDDRQPAAPLLDFLGVANVLENTGSRFVWRERTNYLPRLTAGQKPIFADDLTTLAALTNANFAPQREVYLPPEARSFVTASSAAAQILFFNFAAQHIEATVATPVSTMLVAAQTYYHPWRAYVDGQPVRLWRANYGFQALVVPAGTHQVKLIYEDRRFYFGATVSLVTLGGCICFFFRRQKTAGENK